MSVTLWRIATDTENCEAHDLGGKGAEKTGGRWNRPGWPVVYTSTTIALACLETAVHLNAGGLPLERFLVRIDVPDEVWEARRVLDSAHLPIGWSAIPEGKVSLDIGRDWLQPGGAALLMIPSVIVHEEFNVLINPKHAEAKAISAQKVRRWFYDNRLC